MCDQKCELPLDFDQFVFVVDHIPMVNYNFSWEPNHCIFVEVYPLIVLTEICTPEVDNLQEWRFKEEHFSNMFRCNQVVDNRSLTPQYKCVFVRFLHTGSG